MLLMIIKSIDQSIDWFFFLVWFDLVLFSFVSIILTILFKRWNSDWWIKFQKQETGCRLIIIIIIKMDSNRPKTTTTITIEIQSTILKKKEWKLIQFLRFNQIKFTKIIQKKREIVQYPNVFVYIQIESLV